MIDDLRCPSNGEVWAMFAAYLAVGAALVASMAAVQGLL